LYAKKKIAAVIACRVNSTRLFGKPMQLVGDYPILHLLVQQIKKSRLIDEIVLAISKEPGNEIFVEFAKKNHLKFILGKEEDELERLIIGAKSVKSKIIFRKTSEDPFIYWEIIDDIIKKHITDNLDCTFLDDIPLGAGYEVINCEVLEQVYKLGKKIRESDFWPSKIRNNKKLKIHRYIPEKKFIRPELRLTVDTPQDLWVVRLIYDALGQKDKPIHLQNIIEFLNKNKAIRKINSDIPVGSSRIIKD